MVYEHALWKTKGDFTKSQVIILKQDGKRYLKLPKSTINDIWKRYIEIGSTNTKQHSGWSSLSNSRPRCHYRPDCTSATSGVSVSMTTVKSRLASALATVCVSAPCHC